MTVNADIREVVARILGLDVNDVNETTRPADIEGWDSARFIDLVLALEERLGIQFDVDQLATIETVGDIEGMARILGAS